ncbi:flavoprotein [Luminiphilus syltensis NOR5-1B]|uniref:Flavoprotein n=1 Tax=Luminiphilus syltensis NOR5-1B TaxID=565045 RepID=B8KQE8_9GAMM|nr:NAD(P)H-dependent oxidoreductase [Luminiphilus syltensis]EED35940.1 flavoprotein [Luminiphilus syltensis NOR5-1B]
MLNIGIIAGSHRPKSESGKVGRFLAGKLERSGQASTWIKDLGREPLPIWDESVFSKSGHWAGLNGLSDQLRASDAFIIVTPEWHGMVPSGLKNFLLLWAADGELAHKPALLCSVSASGGGANPIAELRMSSYKNNRLCYLPEHLIVRNVQSVFNEDAADNDEKAHRYIEARSDYCIDLLLEYANAFRGIRSSGKTSLEAYPHGM